jgi:hypothetical protein
MIKPCAAPAAADEIILTLNIGCCAVHQPILRRQRQAASQHVSLQHGTRKQPCPDAGTCQRPEFSKNGLVTQISLRCIPTIALSISITI